MLPPHVYEQLCGTRTPLALQLDATGQSAIEQYLRYRYLSRRALAWPSQVKGIERLRDGASFVLCTPTGSGKTSVAELAILQSLFSRPKDLLGMSGAALAMYLVPSRALAAEVESSLSRAIATVTTERVIVTGLYGGIDWGPTDAWITADDPTILICTYEKAEALIRFLGPLFLNRLSVVIVDEAHLVHFDNNLAALEASESRSLRLESLISRLFTHLSEDRCRIIALSAVAAAIELSLAHWITNSLEATPAKAVYRSTRQLIGRIECHPTRRCSIRYDLLDRADLRFEGGEDGDTPYIPQPFPPHPPAPHLENAGPEKRLRPFLFWAAMHMVTPSPNIQRHSVLISIPQQIGGYAEDLVGLLDITWRTQALPQFFDLPSDPVKRQKWEKCLRICEDYFGSSSREYLLLKKGVVMHHGQMPGALSRLLVELVRDQVVSLVLATSTLSEGVNLPFGTVLVPSLRRGGKEIEAPEVANLAGRAGRPGFGTEGKCLVLLSVGRNDDGERRALQHYSQLIRRLRIEVSHSGGHDGGVSPLAVLLQTLYRQWQHIAGSTNESEFLQWLETAAPNVPGTIVPNLLDSLDGLLLSAIVEIEELSGSSVDLSELETRLTQIWQRCYAHFASHDESRLSRRFLTRGRALVERVYPDASYRRRLYRTGIPPRLGAQLIAQYQEIVAHLATGAGYAAWGPGQRLEYVAQFVALLSQNPKFSPGKPPRHVSWEKALCWWLAPEIAEHVPTPSSVSAWYKYVSTSFGYRASWGIGCIIAR